MNPFSRSLLIVGFGSIACTIGCGSGGDLQDGGDAAAPESCLDIELRCPADVAAIGALGSYHVDTFPLAWEPCAGEEDVSVAPVLYVSVPSDIASMSITVEHGASATGFAILAIDGEEVIGPDRWGTCPHKHLPLAEPASTVVFPMDSTSFAAGGSCMAILPAADGDFRGELGTLHIVSRRGDEGAGRLDLNVVVDAESSLSELELDDVMTAVDEILFHGDAALVEDVDAYTMSGFTFVGDEGDDINELRASRVGTDARRINIFLVEDFLTPGLLGIAGGIPGPIGIHGTVASGVVVGVDSHRLANGTLDIQFIADTIAHELGHQLGWFHTSESTGDEHDCLTDTPRCTLANDTNGDGEVDAEECDALDGPYLMFWAGDPDLGRQLISEQQADVMFHSPVLR
jgi:hypothetical protein